MLCEESLRDELATISSIINRCGEFSNELPVCSVAGSHHCPAVPGISTYSRACDKLVEAEKCSERPQIGSNAG